MPVHRPDERSALSLCQVRGRVVDDPCVCLTGLQLAEPSGLNSLPLPQERKYDNSWSEDAKPVTRQPDRMIIPGCSAQPDAGSDDAEDEGRHERAGYGDGL